MRVPIVVADTISNLTFVMPGLVPGIHVLLGFKDYKARRGWPGQARP